MIHTTFSGQGLGLDGLALPKVQAENTRTPDQQTYSRSILDTCRTFVGTPNEPAVLKGLRAVSAKHSIDLTNEALIDVLAATLTAFSVDGQNAASDVVTQSRVVSAASMQPSALEQALPRLESESFHDSLRQSRGDAFKDLNDKQNMASFEKFRENHKRMWDMVREIPEIEWAQKGTTQAEQLRKLTATYRDGLGHFEHIATQMITDMGDMERIVTQMTPSPWKSFLRRLAGRLVG